ncbi:DMT family transporter [Luteithermobacter gelatinilyticus]|uniref:DMT family transporter n=1 Tax=Luteithermobacter gelatinilyticus TaxID=2582913 RepID=UPI00110611F0|nr:quaternary ammonium compound efflux SMR transporter SugE [Luteithermobacter gelatinilyticus]
MSWVYLFVAGLLEVGWVVGMKYSEGFTRPVISLATGLAMFFSFYLLSAAMKNLPMGTAYAVWTGIGAVGAVVLGILLFGEAMTAARLLCVALIVSGILGLKLVTNS